MVLLKPYRKRLPGKIYPGFRTVMVLLKPIALYNIDFLFLQRFLTADLCGAKKISDI